MPRHCSLPPCVWVQRRAWFDLIQCHITAVHIPTCGYNAVLDSVSFKATSRQSTALRVGTTPCLVRSHSMPQHCSPQPCVWVQRRAWFGLIQCHVIAVYSLACRYNTVLGSVSFNATSLQSTALRVGTTPCLVRSHSMPRHCSPQPCVSVQRGAWFGLIRCHVTAVHILAFGYTAVRAWFGLIQCHVIAVYSLACRYNTVLGSVSFNATSLQSTALRVGTTPCLVRSHSMPRHCSPQPCVSVQRGAWFGLIQCHITAVHNPHPCVTMTN